MITRRRLSPKLPICAAALIALIGQAQVAHAEMGQKPAAVPSGGTVRAADTCGRTIVQRLVGSTITPEAKADVQRSIGHDRIRVIRPGAVINHDLRDDRLNLIVDETGRLMTARCG